MTTRFRNPWIDPRVLDVRPSDAEAYLRSHGWKEAVSDNAHWKRFLSPSNGNQEAVLVPVAVDDDSLLNLLVECIGKVAAWEGRYAGELLSELLAVPSGTHANGTSTSHAGASL